MPETKRSPVEIGEQIQVVDLAPTAIFNVGTGETYTSLTNTGGLFEFLNTTGISENAVVNITSDLTAETVALNQLVETGVGGYTVTIKPSGAARTISGTNNTGGLIRLNGADRVTIDGSLSGGTDRSLAVRNNSANNATAAIHIISLGAGAGAENNTVKNTNLSCNADQTTSVSVTYGISHGGTLLGNGGADNDNNSFINNSITRVNIGIYSSGIDAANPAQNTVIADNVIGPAAFGPDQIGRAGIVFNQTNNGAVTGNEVRFVGVLEAQTSTGGSYDKFGIAHAFNGWSETTFGDLFVTNTLIARNRIHDIVEENTFSAAGIFMAGGDGTNVTANTTINNVIWNVRANGTSGDNGVGLGIASGRGDLVAHNTISMVGDVDPAASATSTTPSSGIQIASTTVVNPVLQNNIVDFNLTSNTTTVRHSAIRIPDAYSFGTGGSNYNDLHVFSLNTQAITGRAGTTDAVTLPNWRTASLQDVSSVAVNPAFFSTTDYHLPNDSALVGLGTPNAAVTNDADGDPRPAAAPDIGADEVVQAVGGVFPAGTFFNGQVDGVVSAAGDVTFTGRVHLNGVLTMPTGTTLNLPCGAGISAQLLTYYVAGALKKDFCALETFTFPVGGGGAGIAPYVSINVTALGQNPSSLTVTAYDATLAGFSPTRSLSQNWQITETGNITGNLTFFYRDEDVNGNEADYRVYQYSGTGPATNMCPGAPCVQTGPNYVFVTGVTQFSRWTAAELLIPTAATAEVSGQVKTAGGIPIRNVQVSISGGGLTETLYTTTGSFGTYHFEGLPAGQTYVVQVLSKRFGFSETTRVVGLMDDLTDVDFIGNLLE